MADQLEDVLEDMETAVAPRQLPEISSAKAAAILLLLLDDIDASDILGQFDPDEMREIAAAMYSASTATADEIEAALHQFVDAVEDLGELEVVADPHIRSVVTHAVGNIRADNILADIAPRSSEKMLDMLRWMEVPEIRDLLVDENPQLGAIIISVLKPDIAAEVLEGLDPMVQADIVRRAAKLSKVSAQAVADLEQTITKKIAKAGPKPKRRLGGSNDVAKIISNMRRNKSAMLLKDLKKADKILGQKLEEEMFLFDDLSELDPNALGLVTRELDGEILTLALKAASPELVERILGVMSQRAAQTIRDTLNENTLVKRVDVEAAQKNVVAVARRLADEGAIIMAGGADDYI